MNFNFPIILASNSPRRQQLLSDLGVEFEVKSASITEKYPPNLPPGEVPEFLAREKAEAIGNLEIDAMVISADTVVILDELILGKPRDLVEAKKFLRKLSQRKHQVVTGVCIKYRNRLLVFSDSTEVTFENLSDFEIDYYLQKSPPLDKAGAYGIQEWIGMIGVKEIKGSYFNVVGLPVQKLYQELKKFMTEES